MSDGAGALIGVLNAYRPNILDLLRGTYPETAAQLAPQGLVLGGQDDAALRAAAIALLDNIGEIASEACSTTERRLRLARKLELVGSILTLACSAGLVSALTGLISAERGLLPMAVISFVGGGFPLLTGWLRSSSSSASVTDALTGLRDAVWEAQVLRGSIGRGDGPSDLVTASNDVARKLKKHLEALGSPAAVRPL